jgi:hypothetical protein
LMHRIGAIEGQWKNVLPRLYRIITEHPHVFAKTGPGEYDILPEAERYLARPVQLTRSTERTATDHTLKCI